MWKQPNPCQEGGISNTEVGSVSEKNASENLCVGDAVMNGYFSASHFVQNEIIYF